MLKTTFFQKKSERNLVLLVFYYGFTFVREFAPLKTRCLFFWSFDFFAADITDRRFLVGPDFYASSTVRTLNEFGFWAKKLFDSRT
jgi:hypothetical protein